MAAYSDNGYVLVALALRFAAQLGLPDTVDKLLDKTSSACGSIIAADDELYRHARIWLGICNLELLYDVYWVTLHPILLTSCVAFL
jgi:hypothetical protein